MKKKWLIAVSSLIMGGVLSACSTGNDKQIADTSQAGTTTTSEAQKLLVTIEIKEDGKQLVEKNIQVPVGTSVFDALKDSFEIKDDKGFITAIDGKSQDETAGKYWMYTVNGAEATVGAKDYVLNDKDTVVFELSSM